jgi:hypothetical protein
LYSQPFLVEPEGVGFGGYVVGVEEIGSDSDLIVLRETPIASSDWIAFCTVLMAGLPGGFNIVNNIPSFMLQF